jgi:hypothetical protein
MIDYDVLTFLHTRLKKHKDRNFYSIDEMLMHLPHLTKSVLKRNIRTMVLYGVIECDLLGVLKNKMAGNKEPHKYRVPLSSINSVGQLIQKHKMFRERAEAKKAELMSKDYCIALKN